MSTEAIRTQSGDRRQPVRPEVLVDTEWLADHLNDAQLRVVEVDVHPAAFTEGHIEGAVLWNIYTDLKDPDYRLVDRLAIEQLVRASGIADDSIVVFYGYGPALGFWLMKLYGHRDVRLLDASRETWQAERRPWSTAVATPIATAYELADEDETIRARAPVVERAIGNPRSIILDVRSDAEFHGERFWPSGGMEDGGRAGHIPGASHVHTDALRDARGTFLSTVELRAAYRAIDLDPELEVIPYCTIGSRASTTWFVLTYLLGHEHVRVYDGSWAEWGRKANAPVEI